MEIQAPILSQGFWFAVVQAGRLLQDAIIIYERGNVATAASIALFAQEELGKAKILRNFFNEAARSNSVTLDQVSQACEDHQQKQLLGIGSSVTLQAGKESRLGELIAKAAGAETHEQRVAASDEVRALIPRIIKSKRSRSISDRTAGLYVDLDSTGTEWRRPSEISSEDVRKWLMDIINRYRVYVGNLVPEMLRDHGDSDLAQSLENWPNRPEAPHIELTRELEFKIFAGC